MDKAKQDETIGAGWIVAMIVLAILLIIGLVLYFQMTAPLDQPSSRLPTKTSVGMSYQDTGCANRLEYATCSIYAS